MMGPHRKQGTGFTPLEAECPAACLPTSRASRGDGCSETIANAWFNAPRGLLTGFTLIEMLISVAIFTIVMFIAVGTLLVVNDALRKTRLLRNTMENVSISMESMAKKIRTGENYDCTPDTSSTDSEDCSNLGSLSIQLVGADGITYVYRLNTGKNRIDVEKGGVGAVAKALTSPEIQITSLKFYVSGSASGPGDMEQARVTITMSGFANIPGKSQFDTNFRIQTTVSKRVFDVFN